MGAGKTILIGAIFATEFAMAFEYPDGPFVQNALVFAPGKTIIESLDNSLKPVRPHFATPTLQAIRSVNKAHVYAGRRERYSCYAQSLFNVIVTNTEKDSHSQRGRPQDGFGGLFARDKEDEAKQEVANLRSASYRESSTWRSFPTKPITPMAEKSLNTDLKKVRKTVDYHLPQIRTSSVSSTRQALRIFQKQPLRDVVIWYSLSEGIRDQILKVKDDIRAYDFEDNVEDYVAHVVEDFFKDYTVM